MAEELTLTDVLKSISKKFGDKVAKIGVDELQSGGTLSLGSPSFDFCLYNSFPVGKIVEFSGRESSGKTTTAFLVAASYIRKELEERPDDPRAILFVDAECACDPEWAKKATGYDMNRDDVKTICITPEGQSAEEIFDMVISFVKTGQIGLVIFDSLTAIVSQKLADASMEEKEMGGIAKTLGDFCKKITGLLNKYKVTFIGINGVTENLSQYGERELTPGGTTWKRACMVRLRFKRGAFFDEDGNELNKTAQNPAGHIIEMYVLKTKVCDWSRKLGMAHLNYSKGIDILADTIDVATFFGYIDNSVQGSFKFVDVDTGEVMTDSDGKEIKIRGKKNVTAYLKEHTDVWRRLYDAVYKKMSIKSDPNIVSFEKMLDVDVYDKLGIASEEELETM